ncbi:MAG: S9 family peptidase [Bacteroidetes bacterium]|nr:S9 family peptidase [Bacteroidota bacterium]
MKSRSFRLSVIAVALLLIFPALAQAQQKSISLEDIFKGRKFSSKGVSGIRSMKDGIHYTQVKNDSLNIYDYETGSYVRTIVTSKQLIPEHDTLPLPISSYEFSDDENRLMFSKDDEALFRHSSKANYFILDLATGKKIPLYAKGKQRLASFSPAASKVAFVVDNNIFIRDIALSLKAEGEKDTVNALTQITTDGKVNEIINGATDWVYEEEFGFSRALFWSPDGSGLAYYRFDESKVKEYQLTTYGELYPEQSKYKYPKPGEDNSVVGIYIYDIKTGKVTTVDIGRETDIYIPRIKWTADPATLALYRLNRHQNKLELLLAEASGGKTHAIWSEDNKCYIDITDDWHFLKNGKEFLISSERSGFNHLYLYSMTGELIRQLTDGKWDVARVAGMDEPNRRVFFTAGFSSPMNREVFSVSLDEGAPVQLSEREGTNSPDFSSNFAYYVNRWSDINTPPSITINNTEGKEVRLLQDNAKLRDVIKDYNFGKADFFTVITDNGLDLNAWILKPPDFDPRKKYPVMFTLYGGPGIQTVNNSWGAVSSWNQLLAQNGIIVVSVDNRGTGARGEEFKKCTYLQLGKYETIDQINAARYLDSLSFVDKDRLGIWGWSFGGYMVLSCVTKGADYFKLGVAVAPVTNWKYYDNIYTERYMRTPKENNSGYEDNSPVNFADRFKGKLLMIHGMADDNVHPQNSYDMVTALVGANKQFEMQLYPNNNHYIFTGKNTSFHLWQRITDFILKNL